MQLTAEWILPITTAPIEEGCIAFEEGVITRLGPTPGRGDPEDLGAVVVIPGLINAHTHLELSHLGQMTGQPAKDLPEWLSRIVAVQKSASPTDLEKLTAQAVKTGVDACLDAGVSAVGDISQLCHLTRPLLAGGPLRVVSFGEVLGIGRRRHLAADRLRVAADRRHDSARLTAALSPHAPYSIDADGVRAVVQWARDDGHRLCMHLAETVDELQFLKTGDGRFREMLEWLGIHDDSIATADATPVAWAADLDLLGPDCLIAHANYVDPPDIVLLCERGASVAFCPRAHGWFGHARYPLTELLGGGVNVCVGTDSLACTPSLDVLAELRVIAETFPELAPLKLLEMATLGGARALGLADRVGTLEVGKRADLAVFSLPDEYAPPAEQLVSGRSELLRLYIDGQRAR